MLNRTRRAALVAATLILATPLALAPPAQAADDLPVGLFGAQDATYDGVYRQSLALLAYAAEDVAPPAEAIDWLMGQQCTDGAFQSFRADPSTPCDAVDLTNYTGPDSNSTAIAAQVLTLLGEDDAAGDALGALSDMQNADGGIPYLDGGASDANSTALTAMAVSAAGFDPEDAEASSGKTLTDALDALQLGCSADAGERGAWAFQTADPLLANDYATVQALLGRAGGFLPVLPDAASRDIPGLTCPGEVTDPVNTGAAYLAARLTANGGTIPDAFNAEATDWGSTRFAVIALADAGVGRNAIVAAWTALDQDGQAALKDDADVDRPGALAEMILATNAAAPSLAAAAIDITRVKASVAVGDTDTADLLERLEATLNAAPDEGNGGGSDGGGSDGGGADESGGPVPTDATADGDELADTGAATTSLALSGLLLIIAGAATVTGARRFRSRATGGAVA